MKRTIIWLFGVALAFTLGVAVGAYRVYNGAMDMMMSDAVDRDATAVRRYVDILENMRAGDQDEAAELLESWMDDVLIVVMEPSNFEYRLQPGTISRADSAYLEAKAYRDAFPRSSSRSFVDEMIVNVWAAGLPSQLH